MRIPAVLGLVLVVTSCTTKDGLPQGAATARAVAKPEVAAPTVRGETRLAVRSFGPEGQEVSGADCAIDSRFFAAGVVSPGRVLLPYYGEQSPDVSVECRLGTLSGQTSVSVVPTKEGGGIAWPSVGVSVNSDGGVGVGLGLGYYGGQSGASSTAYGYPPANVPMR